MKNHIAIIALCLAPCAGAQASNGQIQIKLDSSEAHAALNILAEQSQGRAVTDSDWQALFKSEPYTRLKQRELAMHREFNDDQFKAFVLGLAPQREKLEKTLAAWEQADLMAAAQRTLAYLPAGTRIRAKVYPVIKPMGNSFVWETSTDPAIFLYVDPEVGKAQFDNTVSHELHHIGLASAQAAYNKLAETYPEKVQPLLDWIGAFGEGEAVLAAAGSADVDPLGAWPEKHRIRWEQDMTGFSSQVSILDEFFLDILHGGFANQETIRHVGSSFFGFRGPWYTVGYKMAVIVEKRFGRKTLIECMQDPRKLLVRYNEAAAEERKKTGEALPLWSPEVIAALGPNEKETSGGK